MKGSVVGINQRKGMILVDTGDGEYSLIELLGESDLEIGDLLEGNLQSLGGERVRILPNGREMHTFIQDIHMTKSHGLKRIGEK
jgi:hypothetical protein